MTKIWEKVKGPLEFLLWAGLLGFAFFRFGPQVTAAFGIGGSNDEFSVAAFTTLDGSVYSKKDLEGRVVADIADNDGVVLSATFVGHAGWVGNIVSGHGAWVDRHQSQHRSVLPVAAGR